MLLLAHYGKCIKNCFVTLKKLVKLHLVGRPYFKASLAVQLSSYFAAWMGPRLKFSCDNRDDKWLSPPSNCLKILLSLTGTELHFYILQIIFLYIPFAELNSDWTITKFPSCSLCKQWLLCKKTVPRSIYEKHFSMLPSDHFPNSVTHYTWRLYTWGH